MLTTQKNFAIPSQNYKEEYGHGNEVFHLFLQNDGNLPEDIYMFLGGFLTYDDPTKIIKGLIKNYPEMEGLLGPLHPTPERAQQVKVPTIAEKIFGTQIDKKSLDEFNRTAIGVLCLKRTLMNQQDKFTECQQGPNKLSEENRNILRKITMDILGYNPKALDAMIYYLVALDAAVSYTVINDLGKIKTFENTIKEKFNRDFADHDHLLAFGLEHSPELSPSFSRTSKEYQNVMLNGIKCKVNIGQFMQGEMPSGGLDGIRGMDKKAYDFFMLHFLFDLAGAAGHGVQNGSIVLNNPTFERFHICYGLLERVRISEITYQEAYDTYLNRNTTHFGDFEIKETSDIVIAKVITLLRLTDKNQIHILQEEYKNLDAHTRAILEYQMNKSGSGSDYAFLIYYAPAFLANLMREMQKIDKENGLRNTIKVGLKALARMYQKAEVYYAQTPKKQGTLICDIAEIAANMSDSSCFSKITDCDFDIAIKGDGIKASIKDKRIDTKELKYFHAIDNIPGDKFLLVAMGGGSDSVQATQIANLLKKSGKNVQAIVSIRTSKTGSQGENERIGEERKIQNVDNITPDVMRIHSDSFSTAGRFYENISSQEGYETYVITYNPDQEDTPEILERIQMLQKDLEIQTILAIDTGGDVLYADSDKQALHGHSKDQDISVLKALEMLDIPEKHLLVLAPGIDTPDDVNDIIKEQGGVLYIPNSVESKAITDFYEKYSFDGSDHKKYGKTSNAFYLANKDSTITGFQPMLTIPKENIIDSKNTWDPYVNIQKYTKGGLLFPIK